MELGFVGLGKMGLNMVTRLAPGGHRHRAEGFELTHASEYKIDVAKVASLWMRGSVVRSWLLELTARALTDDRELSSLEGCVEDSGEGRWTLNEAIDRSVQVPVLTAALFTRFRSLEDNPFADRLLAALRQQFGGHAVKRPGGTSTR
jgi:6-phosphogluconate dehydrogenase